MVVDELEVLEDLPPLFDFGLAGGVVMDGQHNRPASRGDFLSVHLLNNHQQRERTALLVATEVVASMELAAKPANKQV